MRIRCLKSFYVPLTNATSCREFFTSSRSLDKFQYLKLQSDFTRRASTITHNRVLEFITTLNDEERQILINAVKTFESDGSICKFENTGTLAAFRWRSEFGRPSKITRISDLNDDGTITKPTRSQLIRLGIHNALPFVGFGFLDNSIMILGGDSIELMLGSIITVSTMTAAAMGNTVADVIGIGSAFYVERVAGKLGIKQPQLTPAQLNLSCSRFSANLGRTIGVMIGCTLGMFPLLFK